VDLIYCAGGNKRFAQIAIDAGFKFGSQLPETVYFPPFFCDQDWKKPNRAGYMEALAIHRPAMASVLDWEQDEQLPEVLDWAEEAAQYAAAIVIIPKVVGQIHRIPLTVGGKPVILGYSVPTTFGATPCVPWEFEGRQVHLLGGSPHQQMEEWQLMRVSGAEVVSVDGNQPQKQAIRFNRVWQMQTEKFISPHRHWPSLAELDGEKWGTDAPYEAFRRSCANIMAEWRRITGATLAPG
jgi:hypothetical protein